MNENVVQQRQVFVERKVGKSRKQKDLLLINTHYGENPTYLPPEDRQRAKERNERIRNSWTQIHPPFPTERTLFNCAKKRILNRWV